MHVWPPFLLKRHVGPSNELEFVQSFSVHLFMMVLFSEYFKGSLNDATE